MIILIMGDFGVGKDTIADMFVECLGEKDSCKIRSWTTRERRFEGEDTHLFASDVDSFNIHSKELITFSKINGHYYWTETSQFGHKKYEFYVIDRIGASRFLDSEFCSDKNIFLIEVRRPGHLIDVEKSRLERVRNDDDKNLNLTVGLVYNNISNDLKELKDDVKIMAKFLKNTFNR